MLVTFKRILCNSTGTETREEPWISYYIGNGVRSTLWGPTGMRTGDIRSIDRSITVAPGSILEVRIKESDTASRDTSEFHLFDDFRGWISINVDRDIRGSYSVSLHKRMNDFPASAIVEEPHISIPSDDSVPRMEGSGNVHSPHYTLCFDITEDENDQLAEKLYNLELIRLHCDDARYRTDRLRINVDDQGTGWRSMKTNDTSYFDLNPIPIDSTAKLDFWIDPPAARSRVAVTYILNAADTPHGVEVPHEFLWDYSGRSSDTTDGRYHLWYRVTPND